MRFRITEGIPTLVRLTLNSRQTGYRATRTGGAPLMHVACTPPCSTTYHYWRCLAPPPLPLYSGAVSGTSVVRSVLDPEQSEQVRGVVVYE